MYIIVREAKQDCSIGSLNILITLGASRLLHTSNDCELTNLTEKSRTTSFEPINIDETISELKKLWPKCSMIHG